MRGLCLGSLLPGSLVLVSVSPLCVAGTARLLLALLGELAGLLLAAARLRLAFGGLLMAELGLALGGLVMTGLPGKRFPGPGLFVGPLDRLSARRLLWLPLPRLGLRGLLACLRIPAPLLGAALGAVLAHFAAIVLAILLLGAATGTVVVACGRRRCEADHQHRGDHRPQDRAWGNTGAGHRFALIARSHITAEVHYA